MRIIKQLKEDEFVIKMEESDLKKNLHMIVAHDYVEFDQSMGIQADNDCPTLTGKFALCANWIRARFDVQINIRDMVDFVLPFLNSHQYCQKDHLKMSDGSDNYCYEDSLITYFDKESGTPMVAVRMEGETKYSVMTRKVYNSIKGK